MITEKYMFFLRHLNNDHSFLSITSIVLTMLLLSTCVSSYLAIYFYPRKPDDLQKQSDLLMSVLNIVCSGFFILIIFITLNVWSYLQNTTRICIKEASLLSSIVSNSQYFDANISNPLIKSVYNYAKMVRTDEWMTMKEGHESHKAVEALNQVRDSIKLFKAPMTGHNASYLNQIISDMSGVVASRTERLNSMASVVPTELRRAITIGGVILAIFLGILWRTDKLIKLLPVIVFDIMLSFNLSLALSMDYPFSGSMINNDMFNIETMKNLDIPTPK